MINKFLCYFTMLVIILFNNIQVSADVVERKEVSNFQNDISQSSQEIIHYARAYRKDTELSPEKENLRQQTILEQVYSSLTKYDAHSSLENAVQAFLENELSVSKYDYTIINANLTDIGGKSHDPVFLIRNLNKHVCYIVKAFRNPRELSSKFLSEISALDFIQQLSMPGIVAINPIAFAIYSNQGEEWGLLLETAAKGQRIDQFVYRLGDFAPNSREREAFFEICEKVFRRMAESFAALHARKSSRSFFIPMQNIEKYNHKLSEVLENPFIIREIVKHFPLDIFIQYVEKIKTDAINVPIFYSYWHGDAHLGNMFYDDSEDIFYFIDVAKLHHSISIKGEPLLDRTMDLVRIEENLRRKAIGLLSESEVEKLLKSFFEAYEQHCSQGISQPIFLFDKTYKKLGRLVAYARYVEEENPFQRSADQAVFESALEYFENNIE